MGGRSTLKKSVCLNVCSTGRSVGAKLFVSTRARALPQSREAGGRGKGGGQPRNERASRGPDALGRAAARARRPCLRRADRQVSSSASQGGGQQSRRTGKDRDDRLVDRPDFAHLEVIRHPERADEERAQDREGPGRVRLLLLGRDRQRQRRGNGRHGGRGGPTAGRTRRRAGAGRTTTKGTGGEAGTREASSRGRAERRLSQRGEARVACGRGLRGGSGRARAGPERAARGEGGARAARGGVEICRARMAVSGGRRAWSSRGRLQRRSATSRAPSMGRRVQPPLTNATSQPAGCQGMGIDGVVQVMLGRVGFEGYRDGAEAAGTGRAPGCAKSGSTTAHEMQIGGRWQGEDRGVC